jgi:hypothetical protein
MFVIRESGDFGYATLSSSMASIALRPALVLNATQTITLDNGIYKIITSNPPIEEDLVPSLTTIGNLPIGYKVKLKVGTQMQTFIKVNQNAPAGTKYANGDGAWLMSENAAFIADDGLYPNYYTDTTVHKFLTN